MRSSLSTYIESGSELPASWLPLAYDERTTLLDYLRGDAIVVLEQSPALAPGQRGLARAVSLAAAGLGRILAPPAEPPPGYALLVDTSAAMTPFLLVLGRYGLLVGGLVVPRFVIDQLQTMAAGPDPVSSRRARRGLERLDVLRDLHVPVHVAENEVPEIDDLTDRLVEVARASTACR